MISHQSIRAWTIPFLFWPLAGFAAEPRRADDPFVGVWRTTSATITFIVSIRADGTGLFVLIDGGANSCEDVTWKEAPGGILVESIPRLRFWRGRHPEEARVEMEPFPPELTSRNLQQFPLAFMMRRDDAKRKVSKEFEQRPLPAGWHEPTPPDGWDARAGRRRPAPVDVDHEASDSDQAAETDSPE